MADIPLIYDPRGAWLTITVPDCDIPSDMVVAVWPGENLRIVHDDGVPIAAHTDSARVFATRRDTIEHAIQREITVNQLFARAPRA